MRVRLYGCVGNHAYNSLSQGSPIDIRQGFRLTGTGSAPFGPVAAVDPFPRRGAVKMPLILESPVGRTADGHFPGKIPVAELPMGGMRVHMRSLPA